MRRDLSKRLGAVERGRAALDRAPFGVSHALGETLDTAVERHGARWPRGRAVAGGVDPPLTVDQWIAIHADGGLLARARAAVDGGSAFRPDGLEPDEAADVLGFARRVRDAGASGRAGDAGEVLGAGEVARLVELEGRLARAAGAP